MTIRLLFSLLSRRHVLLLLLPAILTSIVAGGIAPFMTLVVGQVFQAFSAQQGKQLLDSVSLAALELLGLSVGSIALSSLTSFLWISTGEHNTLALRSLLFHSLSTRPLQWHESQSAAALMAQFSRDTDLVRTATSLSSGLLIQHLTTTITALALALSRSPFLTLLTLSTIPLLTITQAIAQFLASRRLALERSHTGSLATLIQQSLSHLRTVAIYSYLPPLAPLLSTIKSNDKSLNRIWAFSSGTSQFLMMSMFVQAFWFGSKLVREGKLDAGGVMSVFWACLIAASNLQMCVPQIGSVVKGKEAWKACMEIINAPTNSKEKSMRKIRPSQEPKGEFTLSNVTFSYSSLESEKAVLEDVDLFLPSGETTFIVGASGSGKSTVLSLLSGLYHLEEGKGHGEVLLDDQDIRYLDEEWLREHIGVVYQGTPPILPNQTIHLNVAIALASSPTRSVESVTRAEVVDACRAVLLHEFIRDLPDGYDTLLSPSADSNDKTSADAVGIQLSPGQLQRLSLARAYLRNPTILLLDEATSALDPTSRELVWAALRKRRRESPGRMEIVVGHEFDEIQSGDFVYVMKDGKVLEGGFRSDLEKDSEGEFCRLLREQIPNYDAQDSEDSEDSDDDMARPPSYRKSQMAEMQRRMSYLPFSGVGSGMVAGWMLDVVADLTSSPDPTTINNTIANRQSTAVRNSTFPRVPPLDLTKAKPQLSRLRKVSSVSAFELSPISPSDSDRRRSLQFTPASPTFPHKVEDDEEFNQEKDVVESSGRFAQRRQRSRRLPTQPQLEITVSTPSTTSSQSPPGLFATLRYVFPSLPRSRLPLVFLGLLAALCSGAMTPIFSFFLSKLLFLVSSGPIDSEKQKEINRWGGIVLGIVVFDGLMMGTKFFIMETESGIWINKLREKIFAKLVKDFTPTTLPAPAIQLTQLLTKTMDDSRLIISTVLPQFLVCLAMFSVGLIWALARGWELTLAGFAVAPVFAGVMSLQAVWVARSVSRARRSREAVDRSVYEVLSNVRGIHSSSLLPFYTREFSRLAEDSLSVGVRGAFVEGCSLGVASGLIYASEALLFYVGAVLVSKGRYDYARMVETLNLVVFSVSIGGQVMAFTNRIARSVEASREVLHLKDELESKQQNQPYTFPRPALNLRPTLPIHSIRFENVSFAYASNPSQWIIRNLNLTIHQGELTAIVGPSGCGKSTIGLMVQGELHPTEGRIVLLCEDQELSLEDVDIKWWRKQLGIVEQGNTLFELSTRDNILLGQSSSTSSTLHIPAADLAHVSEFTQDFEAVITKDKLSGGQAQRIMIARSLARNPQASVLVMDECTSALDSVCQAKVVGGLKAYCDEHEKTTGKIGIFITHRLPAMRMCDRVVVLGGGEVEEDGAYDELLERKGTFASLVSGGVWLD